MNLPTQYGPYLLLERVSVGGMAEVYKATEYGVDGFERTVAVKRILPHVAEDEEFIAMFKDEAKIAVQLNHGNIAQIYNLGHEQDSFYIALEYVGGRDLRAIFQRCQETAEPMPVAQACYVIMKICEGLDYAHNKKDKYQRELNIVHRDVSPPNILVSFEGEVKLIDFGVAKAAGRASRTQAGILKGKFGYMSPEQVRGMPLDRRSDVFSMGVVLFEMLTGQRLFQAETDFATLERVRAVDVPPPSSLNPKIGKPLENIMYKALAREPEQRYQSAIELHDELQAFMFAQGLFYSRKDLAAWMRQQYSREIELEKEQDRARAAQPPVPAPPASQGPRKSKTISPPGGRPPPPPSSGRKPPPPPPPRSGTGVARRGKAAPTQSHRSVAIGPPAAKTPRPKRKTMGLATDREPVRAKADDDTPVPPELLPPPQPQKITEVGEEPATVPASSGKAPLSPPAMAASRPAKPKPSKTGGVATPQPRKSGGTLSYTESAAPPASDFDWDDDELETRLFGNDKSSPTSAPAAQPRGASSGGANDQVGGAIASPQPQPATSSESKTVRPASVAVTMPGTVTELAPAVVPEEVAAAAAAAAAGAVAVADTAAAADAVKVPAAPIEAATAPTVPISSVPQAAMQGAAPIPPVGSDPPVVPPHTPGPNPGPAATLPKVSFDYEPRRSTAGPIVAIFAAIVVLLFAGFGLFMLLRDRLGPGAEGGNTVSSSAVGPAVTSTRSGLTIQTTPADAKVTVSGQVLDGASPFVASNLQPGVHRVAITREGYLSVERDVELAEGALSLQFTLEHSEVTLVVKTEPPAASVNLIVDGRATRLGTGGASHRLVRKRGSKYEVEAVHKGYLTQRIPLAFTGEASQTVSLTLPGNAIADATPTMSPVPTEADKPSRTPRRVRRTTTRSPKKTPAEEPAAPAATPVKPLAKTATLRIGTNQGVPPAQVYVDGKFVGKTPKPAVKVTPGRHTVRYQWGDRKTITKNVDVKDGGSVIVKAG